MFSEENLFQKYYKLIETLQNDQFENEKYVPFRRPHLPDIPVFRYALDGLYFQTP